MNDPNVATVVLAGGKGTRLYPLTLHHSKPAVPFGGRYRLIDIAISNSFHADYRQIFVIAQYLSGELHQHLSKTYHFSIFEQGWVNVLTPEEEWFNGTADAVRKTLPALLQSSAEYFLILSGDQLYRMDFRQMTAHARKSKAALTIAATPVSAMSARRFGLMRIDPAGAILNFSEKPQKIEEFALAKSSRYLASMGIYLFRREALIDLLRQPGDDFGRHLLEGAVKRMPCRAFVHPGYWEDIGTVASFFRANLALTKEDKLDLYDEERPIYARPTFLPGPKILSSRIEGSIIAEGSRIAAASLDRCVIGLSSTIRNGTVLRNTVMLGNSGVGQNCLIEKSIIDEHVRIGNNVRLINRKKRKDFDGKGIFIRDGIIIVTAGTVLPDGFTL